MSDQKYHQALTANRKLLAEVERLKAEVERLRKAGDAVIDIIWDDDDGTIDTWNKAVNLWNAAKEGKPSV